MLSAPLNLFFQIPHSQHIQIQPIVIHILINPTGHHLIYIFEMQMWDKPGSSFNGIRINKKSWVDDCHK